MEAIRVTNLVKRYAHTLAVDDISFTLASGRILGLLGGNGAGKTTTISLLLGLLTPTSGSITVLGHDMARDRFAALARMNFSSPYISLPARLTVRENLEVYGHLYNVPQLQTRIGELGEKFHLAALLGRPAGELSAGQKTRVALAKALINKPELLLLDEPTASLDPDTGDYVRTVLEDYRRDTGAAILLASHNMAEVERLCDEVLMMKTGKIADRGPPDELIARYGRANMEQVFLAIARSEATNNNGGEATDNNGGGATDNNGGGATDNNGSEAP